MSCNNTDAQPSQDRARKDETEPWSKERVIYLKDMWRFLSDLSGVEVIPEHNIYAILSEVGTPNIPEVIAGEDVPDGMTKTQEVVDAEWLCVKPKITPRQHYRLVLGTVGRPLTTFRNTKELVTGVLDAIEGTVYTRLSTTNHRSQSNTQPIPMHSTRQRSCIGI